VATLDRRKLTVPVLAQAGAFAAVLVIGVITGHGVGKPVPSGSKGPAPRISVTSPGPTFTGRNTELTILADEVGVGGLAMPTIRVEVVKDHFVQTPVAVASLSASPGTTTKVISLPAGHTYQVCVQPPQDWTVTDGNPDVVPGWDCIKVEAGPQPVTATFYLLPALSSVVTGQ